MRSYIVLLLLIITTISAFGGEKVFVINPAVYQNVTFHSKASIESFKGVSDQLYGSITLDPDDLLSAAAVCSVDMRTLDTGIDLRNGHMKENHLHTNTYPFSEFILRKLEGAAKLKQNDVVSFTAIGSFDLHGVSHRLETTIQVTYHMDGLHTPTQTAGEVLHIQGEFSVILKDYNIPRPKFLFLKLAEAQRVTLNFWAVKGEEDENK